MNIIPALVIIVITFSNGVSAGWVTIEDFKPSELANLTSEEKHELVLKKLITKEKALLGSALYYEMLAYSMGKSFFHIQQDINAFQEISAIVRAVFATSKNLLIQHPVWRLLLRTVHTEGYKYIHEFNSFPTAFLLVCADLDYSLKNQTAYMKLKDEYSKETYSLPNKTYHYGIEKSLQDEIKLIEELLNEPQIKHMYAHIAWMQIKKSINSTIVDIKESVLKLAKVPDKAEQVQMIYEQTIDEVIPTMQRLDIRFTVPDAKSLYFADLQFNMSQKMWLKIKQEIPDWKDYFECDTDGDDVSTRGGHCGKTHVGEDLTFKKAWPIRSDFGPLELQNLTMQQEHEIFLKKLVSDHPDMITLYLYLELQAKCIGNDFFGLIKDEKSNIRNSAIARAAIECISKLRLQNHTFAAISVGMKNGTEYVDRTGDIVQGFIELCSGIDNELKNETFYTTRRDEYLKQNSSIPKKTYEYSFGTSTDDQRKIIAELFNENETKRILLHTIWRSARLVKASEKAQTRFAILELSRVPSKSEAVQKIYEESIAETVPFLSNFTYNEVLRIVAESPTVVVADINVGDAIYYAGNITNLVVSKIKEHPDLLPVFKAIGHRYEISKK